MIRIKRMFNGLPLLLCAVLLSPGAQLAWPQAPAWSGQAQCQITISGPGYSEQQTHTWTITGATPTQQGAMNVYTGSWTETGQGSKQVSNGAQSYSAQWTTNASLSNAPLALFVRASDGRLIIKSWHSQLRGPGTVTGTQQTTVNGVVTSAGAVSFDAYEYGFPAIEDMSTSTGVSGSSTMATNGSLGPMQPGGSQGTAACTWKFGQGAGVGLPGGGQTPTQTPAQTPTQTPAQSPTQTPAQTPTQTPAQPPAQTPTQQTTPVLQTTPVPVQQVGTPTTPGAVGTPVGPVGGKIATGGLQKPNMAALLAAQLTQVSPAGTQQPATGTVQPTVSVTLTGANTHFQNGVSTVTFTASATPPTAAEQQALMAQFGLAADAYAQLMQSVSQSVSQGLSSPATLRVSSFQVTSATSAVAQVVIDPMANGPYDVAVTTALPNGKGTETATMTDGFTVLPATSGTYLITISGLQCVTPTIDDQLNRDGKGEEVYAAAFVRQYDRRNGQAVMTTEVQTWEYGDINGFQAQRKQAGSLSTLGGITSGDFIPDQYTAQSQVNPAAAQGNLFPLTLWQGTLTNGVDVLILSPSVWESDGQPALLYPWVQNQTNLTNTMLFTQQAQNEINNATLSVVTLGNSEGTNPQLALTVAKNAIAGIVDATLGLPPLQLLFGQAEDRPIGIAPNIAPGGNPNTNANTPNTQTSALPNTAIVLTREIIEKNAQSSSATGVSKWTTLVIDFTDTVKDFTLATIFTGSRFAHYRMFLQIEKQ